MFFLLSKILGFLLVPFNWCLLLLFAGLLIKTKRLKKILLIGSMAIFVFFSNTFIFQKTISAWEHPAEALSKFENNSNTIVILGGLSSYDDKTNRIHFKEASDRLLQGILLHKGTPESKIIISGGSAEIYFEERPEADYLKEYLINIGLDESCILFEKQSRNTHENALYTAQLCDSVLLKKDITLITSGFHMRRARMCFEKQGFTVSPLAAHLYANHQPLKPMDYFMPSLGTLQLWPMLLKEWMGIMVYKAKGFV